MIASVARLIASGEFDVEAEDSRNRRQYADRNEIGGEHQRSNPRTIPMIKHGPATRTIATIPVVVNEPCVTSDSNGASTATRTPASRKNSPAICRNCRQMPGDIATREASAVPSLGCGTQAVAAPT